MIFQTVLIITARKRSLGQGNIFSRVCQEFCSQGGLPQYMLGYHPPPPQEQTTPWDQAPRPDTPLAPGTPRDQALPRADTTPPQHQAPPGPGTPQSRHPPPPSTRHPQDQANPSGTRQTPLHSAYWKIRSTSGRYASHWNAILLRLIANMKLLISYTNSLILRTVCSR